MVSPGRRPADAMAALPANVGQDGAWRLIRRLGRFTRPQLLGGLVRTGRDTVRSYVDRLEAAGIVRRAGIDRQGGRETVVYELVPEMDPGEETPRVRPDGSIVLQGEGRAAMWRTMKILKEFTAADLVTLGSTEEVPLGDQDARTYCKMLKAAGYLVEAQPGTPQGGRAVYRLVPSRVTGPKAPQIQRTKHVFDPNLRKVVWTGEPEVEL